MENEKYQSEVYVKTDDRGCILRCEGGYGMSNIDKPEDWLLIDRGSGDRYVHCQGTYFSGGLHD